MQIKVACLKHGTRGNKWCATTPAACTMQNKQAECFREERPMPDAPACRGRDGAGCGLSATRQVNYTKKKAGVVTATYYKKLCKRCNDGKRPASRSPSPQRRPPVQRVENASAAPPTPFLTVRSAAAMVCAHCGSAKHCTGCSNCTKYCTLCKQAGYQRRRSKYPSRECSKKL